MTAYEMTYETVDGERIVTATDPSSKLSGTGSDEREAYKALLRAQNSAARVANLFLDIAESQRARTELGLK